jgi:hypothetical protein
MNNTIIASMRIYYYKNNRIEKKSSIKYKLNLSEIYFKLKNQYNL